MVRCAQPNDMPRACFTMGFAGYEASGVRPPRETVWKNHISDRLSLVGCYMIANVSGTMSNGLPDTTLHTNCCMVYLELKGIDSPVRQNQALVAKAYNSKSFYARGEMCCFVYRAPDLLGFLRPDCSIVEIARVDALSDPQKFIAILHRATQPVVRGTATPLITSFIDQVGLAKIPLNTYRVVMDGGVDTSTEIMSYSSGLALKQLTGLTALSAIATYGNKSFDCDIVEITA